MHNHNPKNAPITPPFATPHEAVCVKVCPRQVPKAHHTLNTVEPGTGHGAPLLRACLPHCLKICHLTRMSPGTGPRTPCMLCTLLWGLRLGFLRPVRPRAGPCCGMLPLRMMPQSSGIRHNAFMRSPNNPCPRDCNVTPRRTANMRLVFTQLHWDLQPIACLPATQGRSE